MLYAHACQRIDHRMCGTCKPPSGRRAVVSGAFTRIARVRFFLLLRVVFLTLSVLRGSTMTVDYRIGLKSCCTHKSPLNLPLHAFLYDTMNERDEDGNEYCG